MASVASVIRRSAESTEMFVHVLDKTATNMADTLR
jgi:hypothetical protein